MNKQVKITMPDQMYAMLWQEAKSTGVTMASLVRIAVKEHYMRKSIETQKLKALASAPK